MSNDLVGSQLGSYAIDELVERGGMVEIYTGHHIELEQTVTIKIIGRFLAAAPLLNERFRREATALAQLRHPNIVSIFDFGEIGGGHYLVTDFVEGDSITTLMADLSAGVRYVDQDDMSFITRQIASAIDHAHSRDVLHRDITPASINITASMQARLTDFGLATLQARDTEGEAGMPAGMPEYMAPELAVDTSGITPKSDIYSLGVILYEMMTGVLPFTADTPVDLALKHLNETPPSPRQLNDTLPRAVSQVIMQALAKEAADRYDSAMALANALAQAWKISDDITITALPSGALQAEGSSEPLPFPDDIPHKPITPPPGPRPMPAPQAPTRPRPPSGRKTTGKQPARKRQLFASPVVIAALGLALVVLLGITLSTIFGFNAGGLLRNTFGGREGGTEEPLVIATPTLAAEEEPIQQPTPTDPLEAAGITATPAITEVPQAPEAPIATPLPESGPPLEAGTQVFRLEDATTLIFIPAGPFLMGTTDLSRAASERPQHEVTLSGFWIDQTEITNDQYRLCVDAGICPLPERVRYFNDARYSYFPTVYATWDAANAYCAAMADATGLNVLLPTEAQWEKAASWDPFTATKRRYPWGDAAPHPGLLRYSESVAALDAAEVGSYPDGVSAYGVYDMGGNVWELVQDWFGDSYYEQPDAALDPQGPSAGTARIVRGGAWAWTGPFAISTFRNPVSPTAATEDIGFRCATNATTLTPDNNLAFNAQQALAGAQAAVAREQAAGTGSEQTLGDWQSILITISADLDSNNTEGLTSLIDTRLESLDAQLATGGLNDTTALKIRNTLNWVRSQLPATP